MMFRIPKVFNLMNQKKYWIVLLCILIIILYWFSIPGKLFNEYEALVNQYKKLNINQITDIIESLFGFFRVECAEKSIDLSAFR